MHPTAPSFVMIWLSAMASPLFMVHASMHQPTSHLVIESCFPSTFEFPAVPSCREQCSSGLQLCIAMIKDTYHASCIHAYHGCETRCVTQTEALMARTAALSKTKAIPSNAHNTNPQVQPVMPRHVPPLKLKKQKNYRQIYYELKDKERRGIALSEGEQLLLIRLEPKEPRRVVQPAQDHAETEQGQETASTVVPQ